MDSSLESQVELTEMSLFRKSKKSTAVNNLDDDVERVLNISEKQTQDHLNWDPEKIELKENELRSFIHPDSLKDDNTQALIDSLKSWINNELREERIIVKNLDHDLFDGTILQKLLEALSGIKIGIPEVTQNRDEQRKKLQLLLSEINDRCLINLPSAEKKINKKWDVDSIHSKNLVAILHLLVTLAVYFHAPILIPENINLKVIVLMKENGQLKRRDVSEEITKDKDTMAKELTNSIQHGQAKDAFDTLFEKAIDKLDIVKQELVDFVNKHLNKISLELGDIDKQLSDGVYLILLLGLLEGFFIPLYALN